MSFLLTNEFLCAQTTMSPEIFREQHDLHLGFETPHTKWAKPYAGGKVRVLYLCHSHQFGPRARIVEIMHRFDIEPTAVYESLLYAGGFLKRVPRVLGHKMGTTRLIELLTVNRDCYVITHGFVADLLPEEARYKILKSVSEGAGLIVIPDNNADTSHLLPDELRIERPPWLADLDEMTTYKFGRGRGVVIQSRSSFEPEVIGTSLQTDYSAERLGRAMLWASGKDPEIKLALDAPETLERAELRSARVAVRWSAHDIDRSVTANVRLRRSNGREWMLTDALEITQAGGSVKLPLPSLSAGLYFIEAQARSEAGVESWTTKQTEITSSIGVRLVYDHDSAHERGEPLTGHVEVHNLGAAKDASVRLQAWDAYGRLLRQEEFGVCGEKVAYSIPTYNGARRSPSLVRLEAEVHLDGEAVNTTERGRRRGVFHGDYIPLTTRHHGKFNFLVWGQTYNQNLRPYLAQHMASLGITAQLGRYSDWESTAGGLAWVPYTTSIRYKMTSDRILQPASWNNEEAVNEWITRVVGSSEAARNQGVFVYNLGDENDTFGADASKEDLTAYRRFLSQDFESIEELNNVWGSEYASFDEVMLSDPDDLTESNSLLAKNYPRWFSRRRFMRANYANLVERFQKGFENLDPQAKAGFEGAGWMDDDIDLLSKKVKFWAPYSHLTMQVISAITPPDFICGQWSTQWKTALHGGRMFGWFRLDNEGAVHGSLFAPDAVVRPMHRYRMETRQVWLHGLGTSMMHWNRESGGIVMLYSFPSSTATHIATGHHYRSMGQIGDEIESNHEAWHRNLRASHLQATYITAGMIERGEWTGEGDKLLVLSQIEALSPKQVNVIRDFVTRGGTVIADFRPGVFNHRLQPQTVGMLDDLFGVRHGKPVPPERRHVDVDWHHGGLVIHGTIRDQLINPSLKMDGGQPQGWAGNTPVVVINEVGKGHAILLNIVPHDFPYLNQYDADPTARELFAALVQTAGCHPPISVADERGHDQPDVEVVRWRSGEYEMAALYRPHPAADLSLPTREGLVYELREPRVVTNVRTGLSQPRGSRHFTTLRAGEPAFLLLSEEEPAAPALKVPARVAQGEVLSISVELPDATLRCVRLTAARPDGKPAQWFDRVEKVSGRRVTLELEIALNERTGSWTFQVKDAVTGKSQAATVDIVAQR